MLTVWRIRRKIIRTVLCCIVYYNNCTQLNAHSYEQLLEPVDLGIVSYCVCFCVFLTKANSFIKGLVIFRFSVLFVSCLVVSTNAINCLERFVPEMTCSDVR